MDDERVQRLQLFSRALMKRLAEKNNNWWEPMYLMQQTLQPGDLGPPVQIEWELPPVDPLHVVEDGREVAGPPE